MFLLLFFSCSSQTPEKITVEEEPKEIVDPLPVSGRMFRLTDTQFRNKVQNLVGIAYEGVLPVDYDLQGYINVGAGAVHITPYDLELYEQAAWQIAQTRLPNMTVLLDELTCPLEINPLSVQQGEPLYNISCIEPWIVQLANNLLLRTIDGAEQEEFIQLFTRIAEETHLLLAAQGVLTSIILSPEFLHRIEIGEALPDGSRRLSGLELAQRLSYFLTNSPPDLELQLAVTNRILHDDDILEFHTRRLLNDERTQESLLDFFHQTLDLEKLLTIDKNSELYPQDTPSLRTAMIQELDQLFLKAITEDDFRILLTSNEAFLTPELANLYQMEQAESTGWYTLPPEQQRGGVLGRAGFLALNATAVRSSPTHRGKFIRTRLLCQDIPPPPEGTVTSLDEVDQSLSLRDQLEQHMSDPACSSCHALMDPIGFPLEHFDALGTWRDTDNGHPIDATGTLDNIDVDGAAELGIAVSNHTRFGYCTTAQLMRHSIGVFEGTKQKPYIEELSQKFASSGFVFSELIVSLVLSDAFRYLSGPLDGNACSTEGEERPCASECSTGVETCIDSIWQNCSAAPVEQEICDGLDQDCNGVIDDLSRACHVDGRDGIQTCNIASWSGCETSVTDEVCDGIDNDADGAVDEGLSIRIEGLSLFDIQSQHENCDLDMNPISGPCNAAAHRYCAVQDCDGYTGFGPLIYDPLEEKASIACLDSSQAHILETTFDVLHEYLEYCVVDTPISANCNASINRFCNAQGLGTGFGPIEHSGENAWVVCTPNAEKLLVDYDELSALQEECFWPGNRYSLPCNTAIHTWCATQGYKTGFGPLENSDNHAWVACLPYPMEEQ